MKEKQSTPLPTTPMCDEARVIPFFSKRLQHYRACTDPRCQARASKAVELGQALAKGMRR